MPTTPFRVDQYNAELGDAPHQEAKINAASVSGEVIGPINTFGIERSSIVSAGMEPFLTSRSEEVGLQGSGFRPAIHFAGVEVTAFLIARPTSKSRRA
jgi:hypothetical protein